MMKIFSYLIICFTLSFAYSTPSLAISDGVDPFHPDDVRSYAVSSNYFRQSYIEAYSITDMPTVLRGEWTDAQAFRLAVLLQELNAKRTRRTSMAGENMVRNILYFKIGNQFEYKRELDELPNMAAAGSSGISAIFKHEFQISMNVTDSELKEEIGRHLPAILEQAQAQEQVAASLSENAKSAQAGFCSRLLNSFGEIFGSK